MIKIKQDKYFDRFKTSEKELEKIINEHINLIKEDRFLKKVTIILKYFSQDEYINLFYGKYHLSIADYELIAQVNFTNNPTFEEIKIKLNSCLKLESN